MPLIVYPRPSDDTDTSSAPVLPSGTRELGHAAGAQWYSIPTGESMPDGTRAPTDEELSLAKLELPAIRQLKASTRRRIREEVGDLDDIIADQARQIEALTALGVRLAQIVLGGETLDAELRQRYLERITPIANALDSGSLLLRGDLEGAGEMLARVQGRTDAINRIIAEEYLPRRDALLEDA